MKVITTIMFFFYVLTVSAQNKGDFTFEIEANHIRYNNMGVLNRYLKDTVTEPANFYGDSYINDTLRKSLVYGLSLSYQPLSFMDFGVYGLYRSNRFERDHYFAMAVGDPYYDPYIVVVNTTKIKSISCTFGLSTNVYLNRIFHFEKHESKFLKRFQLAVGLRGGISKSLFEVGDGTKEAKLLTHDGAENIDMIGVNMYHTTVHSTNWSSNIEFKLGYRIIESSLFSTIGFKIGYQFHSTPVLRDKADRPFTFGQEKEEMKLNFSGLYYGVYLNIGK